jgi:glutamine amidotransferase-like uncharacterized protein
MASRSVFRPRTGIYAEGTAIKSFMPMLRNHFRPRGQIRMLGAADLRDPAVVSSLDLLVFPGVFSEVSPFPKVLDPVVMGNLHAGFDAGLCVLGSCASVFQFAAWKSYTWRSADPDKLPLIVEAPGVGLIKGRAWGPVDGNNPVIDPDNRFSDTRLMRVTFNDRSGRERTAKICYANGPGVIPGPNEKIDVFARFTDVKDRPIAAGGKAIGKGYFIFEGVLPEMALEDLPPRIADNESGKKAKQRFERLQKGMARQEDNRIELLNVMFQPVRALWESRLHRGLG